MALILKRVMVFLDYGKYYMEVRRTDVTQRHFEERIVDDIVACAAFFLFSPPFRNLL